MDYDSARGYEDSYHRQLLNEQQMPSDYEVETVDDQRIDGGVAVDIGGMQKMRSVEHRHSSSSMSSPGKLFVGGVSWETTEETFANYFGKFGELVDSVIMTDRMTGKPRGFGFVTFADAAVAEKVLEEEHVIDDRKVDLKRTVPRGDKETDIKGVSKTRKIFVGGLAPFLQEDDLKEYFSLYGDISEHQIMYDHNTGRSRGFGFVTFQTEEAVDKIFSERKVHELGSKQVEIKRAEPKRNGRDNNSFRSNGANGMYDQEDCYGGKANEDYNMYSGYGGYGAYAGNPMVNAARFYGYGGYGYGYGGYGGQMFNAGYGNGSYSHMSGGYGAAAAYGGGKAHGNVNNSSKGSGTLGLGMSRYHPYHK